MPKQIIFIRHGETPYNAAHRLMNWDNDAELTEQGIEQAKIVGGRLKKYPIDVAYASDLRRAAQTAAIVGKHIGLIPTPERLLRERNLGNFGEMTVSEVKAKWPAQFEKWIDHHDVDWNEFAGESLRDVHTRFNKLLQMLEEKHPEENVLIVTHSGYIYIALRDIFNFFPKEDHVDVAHTSITILKKEGGQYLLHSFNDVEGE